MQSAEAGGGRQREYLVTVTTPAQSYTFGIRETRWHIDVDEETSRRLPTLARFFGVGLIPVTAGLSAALFALRREHVTGTVTITMSAGTGPTAMSFTERIQVGNLAKVVEYQQNVAKLVVLTQQAAH